MRFTQKLCKRGVSYAKEVWFMPKAKVGEVTKQSSNLPEAYIKEAISREYWRTPRGINYLPRVYEHGRAIIGIERPWSIEGKNESDKLESSEPPPFVEPIRDWLFFKGDRVQVLTGKDKGKQGIVCHVVQERNWVLVRGLNTEITSRNVDGGFKIYTQEERPLLVTSDVALVDPGDLQPTTAEWAYTEDGEQVRVSTRSGRIIPFSMKRKETYDYKTKKSYKENLKDTLPEAAVKVTFKPSLKTFEMDIADEHGIIEDRVPAKSYWY